MMNRIAPIVVAVVSLCVPLVAVQADEEPKVRRAFRMYRAAILGKDGVAAWKSIDLYARKHYQWVAGICVKVDRRGLSTLQILAKVTILRMRLEFNEQQLMALTGESLFVTIVMEGWLPEYAVDGPRLAHLDSVSFDGNSAEGYLIEALKFPSIRFTREEGEWKVALSRGLALVSMRMKQLVKESGLSENEFLKRMFAEEYGDKYDGRIWDGPLE